jgi:hypothetical protein
VADPERGDAVKRKSDASSETPPEPFVLETPVEVSAIDPPPAATEPERIEPPPQPQQPGVFAPLVGGALAAAAGFFLSHFDAFGLRQDAQIDLAPLEVRQAEALTSLKAEQTASLAALGTRIDEVAQRLAEAEAALAEPDAPAIDPAEFVAIDNRLKAIEAVPPGSDASTTALSAALADLERRVAALGAAEALPDELAAKVDAALAQLAAAEAGAKARAEEAASVAEATRQRTALEDLRMAVDSGAPFEAQLAAVADADLQTALTGPATTGITTLATLQDSFPDAARAALKIAREASSADSWGARLGDFLAAQTGARSLTPQEGSDPDAILSRAEAAVLEGRLADAMTEIASLDPAIAAPFADWTAKAKVRLAAEQALDSAAARLPGTED